MSEYTMCSRCEEKPAAICISCLTDCTELSTELKKALEQSKEIFSKKLHLIRTKETKAKHDFAFIESRYWSGVYNNMFELRLEIERMLDKLNLNEFCILSAYMPEEKREAAISKAKKVGGE